MNIIISNSSPDPIYLQIENQIKSLILKGKLSEGEPLPSIRNLAKELQISVITTKRAYEDLEREHLIQTVQGKGSYIAAQNKKLMHAKQLRVLEEQLILAIETAKLLKISSDELQEMLRLLYGEVPES